MPRLLQHVGLGIAAAAVFLLLAIAVQPAKAGWTGCYVGAQAGVTAIANDTTVSSPLAPGLSLGIDGLSADGLIGGVRAGCDVQLNQWAVLGAFGTYNFADAETKLSLDAAPFFSASLKTGLDREWSIGARAGYLATPTTLLYVHASYIQAEFDDLTLATTFGNASWSMPTFKGWGLGGGVETQLSANVSIGLDYTWKRFGDETIRLDPAPVDLKFEPDSHTAMLTLNWRFGVDPLVQQMK